MPVPCPQVAEYVWHRRGLLALNLTRVDFLLGESLHPRVPWNLLGALGGPLSCPVLLGQLQWPVTLQGMVVACPGHAGSPQTWFYSLGDAGTPQNDPVTSLRMLVPQRDAVTPPRVVLLLPPPKEATSWKCWCPILGTLVCPQGCAAHQGQWYTPKDAAAATLGHISLLGMQLFGQQ